VESDGKHGFGGAIATTRRSQRGAIDTLFVIPYTGN
jgi:hypothetical protein